MDPRWSPNFDMLTDLRNEQSPQCPETRVGAGHVFFDGISHVHHRWEDIPPCSYFLTLQPIFVSSPSYLYRPFTDAPPTTKPPNTSAPPPPPTTTEASSTSAPPPQPSLICILLRTRMGIHVVVLFMYRMVLLRSLLLCGAPLLYGSRAPFHPQ